MKDTKIIGELKHPVHMVHINIKRSPSGYCYLVEDPDGAIWMPKDFQWPILYALRHEKVQNLLWLLFMDATRLEPVINELVSECWLNISMDDGFLTSDVYKSIYQIICIDFIQAHPYRSSAAKEELLEKFNVAMQCTKLNDQIIKLIVYKNWINKRNAPIHDKKVLRTLMQIIENP